ncbi:GP88 family protein [Croceicoccus sp. BE223]|uniref:GP88 family protein n=1 Tax=Croceicoccus sp. BE223 TaxID=2817716 RepID=UPI002856CB72|nr:hypothetical protein [Croceicoccus sp. BE223]MDR7101503.1 hypothetical protein [Croceicoccus sp. BE223]
MTRAASSMRRFGSVAPRGHGIVLPAYHPSARGGRSIFPSRVFAPDELNRLLKSGHNSRKIGKTVAKGPRRGWPIYTLTLEERASCPRECREWLRCYGNNMQAAERIEHGPDLEARLLIEMSELQERHPAGFMVRLHVLGDFYSPEYVATWSEALRRFPALHVFGFTARDPREPIGRAVAMLAADFGWQRAAIRFSGQPHENRASRVIAAEAAITDAILCPAQTGATDCCATCALCWHSERSIAFRAH